ncbi:hypothetical protein T492DRAFT_416017 [Pavlovales sp. CCMP2436]|nr:hypothetical protein T492DRAFT_416017 [Pavlovales sp. CCMP2436]
MAIQEKARAAAGEAGMEPMAAFALQRMTAITADIATQAAAARAVIVAAVAAAAASEVEAAAKAAAAKAAAAVARSAERTVRGVAQAGCARVSEFDLTEDGEADRIYGNEVPGQAGPWTCGCRVGKTHQPMDNNCISCGQWSPHWKIAQDAYRASRSARDATLAGQGAAKAAGSGAGWAPDLHRGSPIEPVPSNRIDMRRLDDEQRRRGR